MEVTEKIHTGLSENSLGALSYLTVIPAILFLAIAPYNRSSYVRFHAWQSIVLGAFTFLTNFALTSLAPMKTAFSLTVVFSLAALISAAYILVVIVCAVRALNGKRTKLPIIGAWSGRQSEK